MISYVYFVLTSFRMKIERTIDKYYYLTGDDKSKIGSASPIESGIYWDFFEKVRISN